MKTLRCEHCGEHDAEIHLTEIVEDTMRTVHLCAACAAARGVTPPTAEPPLADLLAHLGEAPSPAPLSEDTEPCPYCGTSGRDFRSSGRLGCSHCWAHFAPSLRGLLRRVHGSSQHMGKVYVSGPVDPGDEALRLATLRRRLDRAVEIEDFESAARLRDEILELEQLA